MDTRTTVTMASTIELLIEQKKYVTIRDVFTTMQAVDIASLFNEIEQHKLPLMFRLLPKELAADAFVEWTRTLRNTLFTALVIPS